jgi:hypothetical protein
MISRVLTLLALVGFAGGMVGCDTPAPAPEKKDTPKAEAPGAPAAPEAPKGEEKK